MQLRGVRGEVERLKCYAFASKSMGSMDTFL